MPRYTLILLLCVLGTGTSPAQEDRNNEDLKKLQGKWKVSNCIYDGKEVDAERGNPWTFSGNRYKVDGALEEFSIALNASKRPKEMEWRVGDAPQSIKGIYALENDTLKFCYDSRPNRFESKSGSGRLLLTLKRASEGQEFPITMANPDDELLKKENELLKKEIELLKKEIEELKKENSLLKKGGGSSKEASSTKEKESDDAKESVTKVTVDNVEYEYAGLTRNGNVVTVSVMATCKDGNRPVPHGKMTLIDEAGEKYSGNLVGGGTTSRRDLREGVPIKLQWQFGGGPRLGGERHQPPSAKVKRFTAVIIEPGVGVRNKNTIEFRNVSATGGK